MKQVARKAGGGKARRDEGGGGCRLRGRRPEDGGGGGQGWTEVSVLPVGAVEFDGWAKVVEAPSGASRLGRIHFWKRSKTGWQPTFVAAESAAKCWGLTGIVSGVCTGREKSLLSQVLMGRG